MDDDFKLYAERHGFKSGWGDGLRGVQKHPKPPRAPEVFDLEYQENFKPAYFEGYEAGRAELTRRENLLRSRDDFAR